MNTKTTKYLVAAMPAILLFAGCGQELPDVPEGDLPLITASIADETLDTRAAYDNADGKFEWTEGDQIKVPYAGNRVETYDIIVNASDPSKATILSSIKGKDERIFYSVYPASAWVAPASGATSPTVNLKSNYDEYAAIIAGTSSLTNDYALVPMVAKNDPPNNVMDFRHVGGLLRINCVAMKSATKTVVVTFDKDVTGNYTVNVSDPTQPYIQTAGTSSNKTVTFTVATSDAGIGGNDDKSFYLNLPVPCGTYNYVKVEAFDKDGQSLLVREYTDYPIIFERHHGKRLSFSELDWIPHLDGTFSDADETYTGGVEEITIDMKSYKEDSDGNKIPIPFEIQWSDTGADGTWTTTKPDWVMMGGGIDYDGTADVPQAIKVALAPQANSIPMNNFGVPLDKHTLKLQASTPKTTDLAKYNVATGTVMTKQTTANCYVVQAPGTYTFPLVYGNAIKEGATNELAYHGRDNHNAWLNSDYNVQGTGYVLGYFKDHLGANITYPYIADQLSHKSPALSISRADVLWMDAPGLISSVNYTAGNNYLSFTVTPEGISQGNAVIAIYDNNGKIAWSWHIWITDADLTKTGEVLSDYRVSAYNLGWCDARTVAKYEARDCYMRIVQTDLGGEVSNPIHIVMEEGPTVVRAGNNPFYHYGRKDPLPGSNGDMELPIDKPCYTRTGDPFRHSYANPAGGTLALGIQNPHVQYIHEGEHNAWCDPSYNNLWNSTIQVSGATVTKTIYDPSPVGFKMPPFIAYHTADPAMENVENFVWVDNFIMPMKDKDGQTYNQDMGPGRVYGGLFFPATGSRHLTLSGIGTAGHFITAIPGWYNDGYGSTYIRYTPYTIIATSGGSTAGLSVRCAVDVD